MKYRLQTEGLRPPIGEWLDADVQRDTKAEAKADLLQHVSDAKADGWNATPIGPDTEWVTLGKGTVIYHAAITTYTEGTDR